MEVNELNLIKQSYRAIRYHKRNTLLFFGFFTILLVAFVFINQLLQIQHDSNRLTQSKWNDFKEISAFSSTNLHEEIIKNNQSVVSLYGKYFVILVLIAFAMFFLYGLVTTTLRRQEISYMKNIGLSKLHIFKHLYTELILIAIASFLSVTFVLCVMQNIFIQGTSQINQAISKKQLAEQELVFNQVTSDPQDIEIQPAPNKKAIDGSQMFVTFNEHSIFSNKEQDSNLQKFSLSITESFLILFLICAAATLFGSMVYLSLYFKRMVN
ncbi:ABC transporter permease [Vagococcus silagei]|uniref:ABC transporter permease n=1 Tax=Vagococcus silagei TaxID=2508885 RepID=A0A4V3TV70_9ENTE|nr:ABC transporter permease [Vagococcus silagei]